MNEYLYIYIYMHTKKYMCIYREFGTTILVVVEVPTVQQRCGDPVVVAAAVGDVPSRQK